MVLLGYDRQYLVVRSSAAYELKSDKLCVRSIVSGTRQFCRWFRSRFLGIYVEKDPVADVV